MEAQTGSSGSIDPEPSQPRMFGGYLKPVRLPLSAGCEFAPDSLNYCTSLWHQRFKLLDG